MTGDAAGDGRTSRCVLFRRPGEVDFACRVVPAPARGQVRIQVASCGICGSDLHWYRGRGQPPTVCPGHEVFGRIEAVGEGVQGLAAGDRVAVEGVWGCGRCAECGRGATQRCERARIVGRAVPGGMADLLLAPVRHVFPVPAAVPDAVAPLTEPTAVAVHALSLADLRPGQTVLVLGAGAIGLLTAAVARLAGAARILVTARHPHQKEAASRLGVDAVIDASDAPALRDLARQRCVDVVAETVGGSGPTLAAAVECVRPGGSVAIVGVFERPVPLDAERVLTKEIRLVGSMAYGRENTRPDFEIALGLLAREGARLERLLVTHRLPLEEAAEAFCIAAEKREGAIKVLLEPGGRA